MENVFVIVGLGVVFEIVKNEFEQWYSYFEMLCSCFEQSVSELFGVMIYCFSSFCFLYMFYVVFEGIDVQVLFICFDL